MITDHRVGSASSGRLWLLATAAVCVLLSVSGGAVSCSKEPEKAPASTKGVDPRKAAGSLDKFSGPDPRDAPATPPTPPTPAPPAQPQDKPLPPTAPPKP